MENPNRSQFIDMSEEPEPSIYEPKGREWLAAGVIGVALTVFLWLTVTFWGWLLFVVLIGIVVTQYFPRISLLAYARFVILVAAVGAVVLVVLTIAPSLLGSNSGGEIARPD